MTNVPVPRVRPSLPAPTPKPVDMTIAQSLKSWLRHHSRLYLLVRDRLLSHGAFYRWAIRQGLVRRAPDAATPGPQVTIVPNEWRVFEKSYMPAIKKACTALTLASYTRTMSCASRALSAFRCS